MIPERAMRLALAQARRASGRTFPNPPVGAVVFRGERVLGRGFTRPVGGAHAEIVAIEAAIRRHGARAVRGAQLAVTLEPCSHTGHTPPCADRVIGAGLAAVWVGHRDPHPAVSGRGIARLRRAGVRVEVGVLERECREQHRGFLCVLASGRPFVSLKLAATLDGRIATARGESRWISGPGARAAVHRLRQRADAIWVGVETALADDPELTARRRGHVVHTPVRLVADTRLRLAPAARMLRGAPGSTWVLCGPGAPRARRRALEAAGARVLELPRRGEHLDLRRALRRLGQEGLTEILVEGGGRLAAGLLRASLVDELHWFTAPLVIGGDGRAALGDLGVRALAAAPRLVDVSLRRLGDDAHWVGRFAPSRGSGAMKQFAGAPEAARLRLAIVVSRFNHLVSVRLLEGATSELTRRGVADDDVHVAWVPGAFEIPQTARALADTRRYDAIIALGVVIRGGTPHFDYVCQGVTDGVREVMRDTGVPVAFGVLTTDDVEQALERAGGEHGNKGRDAALVAIEMARLLPALREQPGDVR